MPQEPLNRKKLGKYSGYIIDQGIDETKHKFLRRIIFDVVLQENDAITVEEMAQDLRDITGLRITICYLLVTMIFSGSGIMIGDDIVWTDKVSWKANRKIRRLAAKILEDEGGKMERQKLFSHIREKDDSLTEASISQSLFYGRQSKFKQEITETGAVISLD